MEFHSKEQIIKHVRSCNLRRSILRAMDDVSGKLEFLGGFHMIPPGESPGFILDVTSRYGQTWHVAVVYFGIYKWLVRVVKDVPWDQWTGNAQPDNWKFDSIYSGDNPNAYEEKKIQMQSERAAARQGLHEHPPDIGVD